MIAEQEEMTAEAGGMMAEPWPWVFYDISNIHFNLMPGELLCSTGTVKYNREITCPYTFRKSDAIHCIHPAKWCLNHHHKQMFQVLHVSIREMNKEEAPMNKLSLTWKLDYGMCCHRDMDSQQL